MLDVELKSDDGAKLQLKNGKAATLKFPIVTGQTSTLNTIPLWHFDVNTGIWKEEGSATKMAMPM